MLSISPAASDAEWEDQFKELDLKMRPSEYWRRQCYATYQSDPIGVKWIDELGEGNIMWGSDFPHPDGVWPDSQEYIQRELGHLPAARAHRFSDLGGPRFTGDDCQIGTRTST
jgi:hypothetical protein